ncbi:cysteine--tRNA ligase [Candidatus Pacearchaeota archaeon CG10_big_fil_rev_8_21_14_0_10_35_13]|nr:MAG: cysteine--tRNA ligase [Candidatus Pacearchaeota archaeon CG10_big_fil_rev_8_21_14_0_10_35_13]
MIKEKIYLYNTLTRKKEEFKPSDKDGRVKIYSCGPTVYWYQHVGNMRAYTAWDILRRVLEYNGLGVELVMNYTDVGHLTSDADEGEDKMEKAVKREGRTAEEIAEHYIKDFELQEELLNIIPPTYKPRATENIKEIIEYIKVLEKKGFTYKTSDGIYFDTSKIDDYGKLANLKIEKIKAGNRVTMKEKKNPTDFALWKFSEREGIRQQEWESPWSVGFPGWHIECSVMGIKYLGEVIDIHTGGQDHIPVHHTNEIAQDEAYNGKKVVRVWMHNGFLRVGGEKVSKSKGGLKTIIEMKKEGYEPLGIRYYYLLTHYKKPMDYTKENLESGINAYKKLKNKVREISNGPEGGKRTAKREKVIEGWKKEFLKAINDDLNIPKAIGIMNKILKEEELNDSEKYELIKDYDKVLGLKLTEFDEVIIPEKIKKMAEQREEARKMKEWKKADEIREKIKEEGWNIEDSEEGTVIKRYNQ